MVPQHTNPPGDSRTLSPAVQAQLEYAIRAFATDSPDAAALLQSALGAVAGEGRERGLRPEELVIAIKTTEERVAESTPQKEAGRSDLRIRMIRAMLEVYYRG
jgi:hypothetical protein